MENENKKQVSIWDSNPKVTFMLGLVAGIAIMSLIGLVLFMQLLFSGKMSTMKDSANPNKPTVVQQDNQKPQPKKEAKLSAPVDPKKDHVLGPKDAKVTLVEYSDFECPYCARHYDTMKKIEENYKGKVRIVFRHFPLGFHAHAEKAAEASECAGDQGKFWEMHDKLFELNKAKKLGVEAFKQAAKDLGLDSAKFDKCLDSGEKADVIKADQKTGAESGVEGTPGTFVNDKFISGAYPYETFSSLIDKDLK